MSEEIRKELTLLWERADREALELKDSQYALKALIRRFRTLNEEERPEAEMTIGEWVLSHDSRKQYDAISLVSQLRIRRALPMLRELSGRFEESGKPDAPFNWTWVNRVIGQLTQEQAPGPAD